MESSKKRHLIPGEEDRCVWMTAGILTYRLCDHLSDCDDCPLDAAMRKHFSRHTDADPARTGPDLGSPAHPEALRDGFLYAPNHSWIRKLDARSVRVGVEPALAAALLHPKTVVLPYTGQFLQRGQTCLWIVTEGGTFPLDSPCAGTVCNINRQLADQPHLLRLKPLDEGWLYDLETTDSSLLEARLLDPDRATHIYGEDEACFLSTLGNAIRTDRSAVGLTLADGGRRLQHLADLMSPAKYFAVLQRVYGA
jgi:glycine cleavage system H lipoate-binding protein